VLREAQRRAEIDQVAQRARDDLEKRHQRLEEERQAAAAVVADEARVAGALGEQLALEDAVRRAGEALLVQEGRAWQFAARRPSRANGSAASNSRPCGGTAHA
jgi:hypothetical protein